mgnify:CR=1 FL=1
MVMSAVLAIILFSHNFLNMIASLLTGPVEGA